jgi:hypothetical protein
MNDSSSRQPLVLENVFDLHFFWAIDEVECGSHSDLGEETGEDVRKTERRFVGLWEGFGCPGQFATQQYRMRGKPES